MDASQTDQPYADAQLLVNLAWTRGLARSLVRGSERAEEIVQETWWRVLRNPAPDGVPARAWISGVMRRVVSDITRSSKRRERREQAFARSRPEQVDADHDEAMQIHTDLVQHVGELEAPMRRVVLLRYFDGLTLQEIAKREGLQVSGVRSRLERAHERLRTRLAQHPERPASALLLLPQAGSKFAAPAAGAPTAVSLALLAMKFVFTAAVLGLLSVLGVRLLDTPAAKPQSLSANHAQMATAQPDIRAAEPRPTRLSAESPPGARVGASNGAVHDAGSSLRPDPSSPQQAVSPPSELEVVVIDEQGSPVAGMPMLLAPSQSQFGWQGETDEEGRVVVDAASLQTMATSPWAKEYSLRIHTLCGPEGVAAINLHELPTEPVQLVSHSVWGSMELTFVDSSGAPLDQVEVCKLRSTRLLGGVEEVSHHEATAASAFRFDFLPLGETVEVSGLINPPWSIVDPVVAGPAAAGENLQVQVELAATIPTVIGRFTGPWANDGPPKAQVNARVEFPGTEKASRSMAVRLGPDRSFTGQLYHDKDSGLPCSYVFEYTDFTNLGEVLRASTDGTVPGPGEIVDLGEISFSEPAPIVAGVVKDQAGNPVPRAIVQPQISGDPSASMMLRRFEAITASDGRFQFAEYPQDGEVTLRISALGFATQTTGVVSAGSLAVEVVLMPEQCLAGKILPCPNLHPGSLRVVLHEEGPDASGRRSWAKVNSDWTFTFRSLQARSYTLRVSAKNGMQDMATLPGLWPAATGQSSDQEVALIDLQSIARVFQIKVKGAEGKWLDAFYATSGEQRLRGNAGIMDAVLPTDAEWLTLVAEGHLAIDLPLANLPGEVSLPPGLEVDLIVPSGWPEGVDRSQVHVMLIPTDLGLQNPFPNHALREVPFGSSDSRRVILPGPASYSLVWMVMSPSGKFMDPEPFGESLQHQSIEVIETSEPQVFDLGQP